MPNLVDKFIQGNATAGTEHNAGLPNITGEVAVFTTASNRAKFFSEIENGSGALSPGGSVSQLTGASFGSIASKDINSSITINASNSNSIYGNSTTVQPPALTMKYIIKY